MTLDEALHLIGPAAPFGDPSQPARWADLGCGSGLFTLALAQLLPPGSTLYAIDLHPTIQQQTSPGGVTILPIKADFVKDNLQKTIPLLDGILMANSLHYVKDKGSLLEQLRPILHPRHDFLIVEYDTDRPVPTWVPYPIPFAAVPSLFSRHGYTSSKKMGTHPSIYGRADIYAALLTRANP